MRLVVYERDDCGGSFAADSREGLEVVAGCSGNLTKGTEVAHDKIRDGEAKAADAVWWDTATEDR